MMIASLTGVVASSGIAFGTAYKLVTPKLTFTKRHIDNKEQEINRLQKALATSKKELQLIREQVANEQGEENAAIFDAHLLILSDTEFITTIEEKITADHINAESALLTITDSFITLFGQMENEYMRERASDIRDVTNRVLANLLGKSMPDPGLIESESILIATDLSPSETAQINKKYVQGFVTDNGGKTSHSAIIARALEIPAIVGAIEATTVIDHGDELIIDGIEGIILINPSTEVKKKYQKKHTELHAKKRQLTRLKNRPTITQDGERIKLAANIASPKDVTQVLANGAEGIGLYRTEFLYMESTRFPTEEQQFQAYKTVLEKMGEKAVIVRTLDIGGDKHLPYWKRPEEANPFLGLRAVRLMLKDTDIFRTQLRALLRASAYGNLKIMFPMIATLEELQTAKEILQSEKEDLLQEGHAISETIEIGIMVEIPSTAVLADVFAPEVDFFSIGTNDLIQYTFAADRMNENVAHLYQPLHPVILRLIKYITDAAHAHGKWVGMCGEMAGDQNAIPLLLGLGLDELSMSVSSILETRKQIQNLAKDDMEPLVEKALTMQTTEEVLALITEKFDTTN